MAGAIAHVLGLADTALSMSRGTDPATESLFVICRARALAESGKAADALREAERAATWQDKGRSAR
ncbi:hypothetical protein GCM10009730_63720 [Streptomyces albidochromogenes]